MILELTQYEQSVLLGILEDLSQEDDIIDSYYVQERIAIKDIIKKLGGTYFGKL